MTHPVAEIGMIDDWSYVKTARVLAQTGHVVYNGWATAMVGWQLYWGALFIKLFGPSFTAIRASTLLVALATAFLTHRTMVRAGVNSFNATIGSLALILSPLFLPLTVSFMTDIGGLFCIVLCLYACLRALQAKTNRRTVLWLAFAASSNALGGTARQIAWLGVLVMFPCAIWILRKRPHVVAMGIVVYLFSAAFIYACMHWFKTQPYSLAEPLLPGSFEPKDFTKIAAQLLIVGLSSGLFLLPVLAAFLPMISRRNRSRSSLGLLVGLIALNSALFLSMRHSPSFSHLLAPFVGNYVTEDGLVNGTLIKGQRPEVLSYDFRIALTIAVLVALVGFFAFLYSGRKLEAPLDPPMRISYSSLIILTGPMMVAYLALLMPRGLQDELFDRYLLPILFVECLFLLRLFEDRVQPHLPAITILLTLIFAGFSVAGTHDAFSLFRAKAEAIAELRAAGVRDRFIDAGLEHNGMTQIDKVGYMNDPRIQVPSGVFVDKPTAFPANCSPQLAVVMPVITPGYALSFDPNACGGLSTFKPIYLSNWLGERRVAIYVVNTVKGLPAPK